MLILTFSTGLVYQTCTVVHFYMNRAEIAAQHCVNKDRPQMQCHGKCHLEKQLTGKTQESPNQEKVTVEPLTFWLFGVELIRFQVNFTTPDSYTKHDAAYLAKRVEPVSLEQFVPPDLV